MTILFSVSKHQSESKNLMYLASLGNLQLKVTLFKVNVISIQIIDQNNKLSGSRSFVYR